MKRRTVLCTVLVIVMAMAGILPVFATGSGEGEKFINLYSSGSDNVRIVWEAVIEAFHKTNPGFTVKQQYVASGTGGQTSELKVIAAWQAKQKEIDVDIMADIGENEVARVQKEASLEALFKLDPKKIPNWANVAARSVIAPDRAMAFRGTAVFIAYNSDKVPTPPKTEKELHAWIKANPGKFAYNDPGTGGAGSSFVTTTIYNLMPVEALTSSDEKWMAQWDAGLAVLKDLHPFLYKASGKVQYTVKNQGSLDLLADGTIWMCPAWADMTLDQKSRKLLPASIKLTNIEPSLTGNLTMVAIPSASTKAALSQKFLNYIASVEAQDIFVRVMKAIPVIDTAKLPPATIELLSGLKVTTKYRTSTLGALGTKLNARWTQDIATLP
jgi:putative spermidine/putrescine transport system substrate-binding protein